MSRSYRHIQECNKEIIELKHNGCPIRQICEQFGFSKNTTLYYFECSLQNTRQEIRGREEILLGVTSRPYILKSTINSINYRIYRQ